MPCSADDLALWKDFPKGLGILLCDQDRESAADTKMKLEAMDYTVYSYCKEEDAMEAVLRKAENYHIAIVEVAAINGHASFKFLEMVKDIPTIVISEVHCLNTVMKCIALGAAEFLQKPLSEEKLRNIWQHVVHKAFNAGGNAISTSLKPIKDAVATVLQIQSNSNELKIEIPSQLFDMEQEHEVIYVKEKENDKFSAPSTPQQIKGERLNEAETFLDQPDCSEKDCAIEDKELSETPKCILSETKFVDNACNNITVVGNSDEIVPCKQGTATAEEELNSAEGSKADECNSAKEISLQFLFTENVENDDSDSEKQTKKKSFVQSNSCLNRIRGSRRKMKVDWTPELHRRFVKAIEQLGIDQAIPSKILELMKVEGLTRHNVASHLQKFRMHKRHILPKEDDRRWQVHTDPTQRGYMQKPIMAFPPYHSNYIIPPSQPYPIWPHQAYHVPNVQMWRHSGLPTWHPPPENWQTKIYPEIHADAWGCPVLPHYSYGYGQFYMPPQGPAISNSGQDASGDRILKSSYDHCPAEEVIDKVVKEAMKKPWLPLPLGLKPPSTEKILAELHNKGIHTIPPLPRRRS
ncbi:two-component response regulator-like APRR2 isoform X2 [Dendrobium catenatum]|uniref:Two-component response regulator-like APRR2 n=1 Tax=Dendrobium catenatum TaxID=906689 RepID=A0A2I0VFH9_9ASPA|nr:two-component response regulator-like APRR2 isoform X2 [Dendrobium catenatum]PKU62172.1 Two-component response regulator-like APRR2 [Dendrobium catenatum]